MKRALTMRSKKVIWPAYSLPNQMISPVASTLKVEANHFVARKVGFESKAYLLEKIEEDS